MQKSRFSTNTPYSRKSRNFQYFFQILTEFPCGLPAMPANAETDEEFGDQKQAISITCRDGFKLNGNRNSASCTPKTGVWSRLPECVCQDAPAPSGIRQIRVNGSAYRYECDPQLVRVGREMIACDPANGIWEPPPICKKPQT